MRNRTSLNPRNDAVCLADSANATQQFVSSAGPSGTTPWHFIDYGAAAYDPAIDDFFEGWADFTLPPVEYTFFLNAKAWDPQTDGEYELAKTK